MADSLSDARAFQERVDGFDEWLREGGHADVADLLRDLLAEHARLRHRATSAQHRASAEYDQRIDVQARLDLFKTQLSVQEARTESWHHAYDALHAQLEAAEKHLEIKEAAIQHLGQQLSLRQRDHGAEVKAAFTALRSAHSAATET